MHIRPTTVITIHPRHAGQCYLRHRTESRLEVISIWWRVRHPLDRISTQGCLKFNPANRAMARFEYDEADGLARPGRIGVLANGFTCP